MSNKKYIKSIIINNQLINIGKDDYGQCYFFEYYNTNTKEIEQISLGSYNYNYEQEIRDYFQPHKNRWNEFKWRIKKLFK